MKKNLKIKHHEVFKSKTNLKGNDSFTRASCSLGVLKKGISFVLIHAQQEIRSRICIVHTLEEAHWQNWQSFKNQLSHFRLFFNIYQFVARLAKKVSGPLGHISGTHAGLSRTNTYKAFSRIVESLLLTHYPFYFPLFLPFLSSTISNISSFFTSPFSPSAPRLSFLLFPPPPFSPSSPILLLLFHLLLFLFV